MIASRLIDARPAVVETRSRCGDWEGDLIVGTASRSAIGTVVDRKSRYVHLVHLPDGHTAADLAVGLRATMGTLAADLRFTLTWDQGSEMAAHDRIGDLFDEGVFFAHAGKPWQRGSNENTVSIEDGSVGADQPGWCRQLEVTLENTDRLVGVSFV